MKPRRSGRDEAERPSDELPFQEDSSMGTPPLSFLTKPDAPLGWESEGNTDVSLGCSRRFPAESEDQSVLAITIF